MLYMHISIVDFRKKIAIIYGFERSFMKFDPKFIEKIINHYKCDKTNLLAILADIQGQYNWLPSQALKLVAEKLQVPMIDVYGVASFYHAFSLAPRGKHIVTVCQGTACHVRGAPILLDRVKNKLGIEPGCTTKDDRFTLETVNCLGACALAPIVVIDGNYHGKATAKKADAIIDKYSKKSLKKTKKKPKKTLKKQKKMQKKAVVKKQTPAKRTKKTKKTVTIKKKVKKTILKKTAKKTITKGTKKGIKKSSKKKEITKKRK
ncbi:MAG: NAD(P)H-dependent oxidoreductase subunit E [bacterium]